MKAVVSFLIILGMQTSFAATTKGAAKNGASSDAVVEQAVENTAKIETTDLVPQELAQPITPDEANLAGPKAALDETATMPEKSGVAAAGPIKATAQTKESDIQLNLDAAKKNAASETPWVKMLASLVIVLALGGGTYIALKKRARSLGNRKDAPQIKVLTQHYLGPKKSIAIIRVAGESILVGITDHNITHLKTLSLLDEEIPVETPESFGSVFNQGPSHAEFNASAESDEDFAMHGIKDFVSGRLKNMRTLE